MNQLKTYANRWLELIEKKIEKDNKEERWQVGV